MTIDLLAKFDGKLQNVSLFILFIPFTDVTITLYIYCDIFPAQPLILDSFVMLLVILSSYCVSSCLNYK